MAVSRMRNEKNMQYECCILIDS